MDILDVAVSSITFLTLREKFILKKALSDQKMAGGPDCCPEKSEKSEKSENLAGTVNNLAGNICNSAENINSEYCHNSYKKNIIRKNIDSLDKLAVLSISDVSFIIGRQVKAVSWSARETVSLAVKSWALMERQGINGVRFDEEAYPSQLKEIFNPPYMIFYRGDIGILEKECISIVGTRRICNETAQAAFDFARDAVADGKVIVSGLANGIDSFAHKGSLAGEHMGCSAAVLPCGIDTIVPAGHKKLVEQMLLRGGVILSEYIPGCPAEPWRFVQRNRIIAALSQATVVVQAPAGSGALFTADFALECNRDLFFHAAGFCDEANRIAALAERKLRSGAVKNGEGKLKCNSQKYLEEGAPVIGNYDEYVSVRAQPPGTFLNKYIDQQPLLEGLD